MPELEFHVAVEQVLVAIGIIDDLLVSKIERADALEGIASIIRQSCNKTIEHLLRAKGEVKLGPKLKKWQRDLMYTDEFRSGVAHIEEVVRERLQVHKQTTM